MASKKLKTEQLTLVANKRHFKRVAVSLPGAICSSKNRAELIKTVNISEGGVCINYDGEARLKPGSEVSLQLEGVLCSGPQRDLDIYRMLVVYHAKKKVGLRFKRFV